MGRRDQGDSRGFLPSPARLDVRGACPGPQGTTLDVVNVRQLTAAFRLAHEAKPNCIGYWSERAGLSQQLPFERLGFKYSNGLLTPKDYASHFKNILHHRLLLRSIKPSNGSSRCRCCHRYIEDTRHLAACKVLRKVWLYFNRLVAATHRQMKLTPELVLHGIATDNS